MAGFDVIEQYLGHLRAGGTPATTAATRRSHMVRLARCLGDPLDVDGPTLVAWCSVQSWAVETRRGYRGTLRSFYGWARDTGRVEVSPADALPRVRPATPTPRPAAEDVYRTALAAADPRLRLILRLAAEVGLRRAEVAGLHADDLTDDLAAEVARAARTRGYLFPGADGGHLSPRWVGKLVTRALPDGVTMHMLRHRFGTRVYGATRDLLVTQDLLGHASPATTRRYVAVPDDAARAAVIHAA